MTQKEFYKMVADGQITEEVKAYAQNRVDVENEKRASKIEADKEIIDALMDSLTNSAVSTQTVFELTSKVAGKIGHSVTWQKVSMVLRGLVNEGKVWVGDEITDSRSVRNVYALA